MDIMKFIIEDGLIMIPVIYVIIVVIKNLDMLNKKFLPLIALVLSIIITPSILVGGYIPDNIVQAILIAGATVFTHELTEVKEVRK